MTVAIHYPSTPISLIARVVGLAGLLLAGLPGLAAAQVLPGIPPALEPLSWMEGEWRGSGWIEQGPSGRSEFTGTEVVERRMGGRLVLVEGSFTAWMGPELGEQPVHQALGIFSYDRGTERLVFRTYTAQGMTGEARVDVQDDGAVVWSYENAGMGRVRYTIRHTSADEWEETGERATGDTGWEQFFQMTLTRQSITPTRTP